MNLCECKNIKNIYGKTNMFGWFPTCSICGKLVDGCRAGNKIFKECIKDECGNCGYFLFNMINKKCYDIK